MKKQLLIVVGIVALAANAQALITGGLSFTGDYIPRDAGGNPVTNLSLATQVQFGNLPFPNDPAGPAKTAGTQTGSFAALPDGTPVIYGSGVPATFTLSFLPPNTPLAPFFTVDGFVYNLNTVQRDFANAISLVISGTGTFNTLAGNDPTPATYVGTFNTQSGTFSYSTSVGTVPPTVPDGGSAMALLGVALVGIEALRRKFAV